MSRENQNEPSAVFAKLFFADIKSYHLSNHYCVMFRTRALALLILSRSASRLSASSNKNKLFSAQIRNMETAPTKKVINIDVVSDNICPWYAI
jgi:hypothetical protein